MWEEGRFTDLGRLPGRPDSQAVAINERGQVIGNAGDRAFVWKNGTLYDLGTLSGGNDSSAVAINEKGQVAGYSTTKDGQRHAVLWSPRSA